MKFWCKIFCALCVDFRCTRASQKNPEPRQDFSVSRAPYRAPYCIQYLKDFKFIRLQISYDLIYLKLFFITYIFRSADNMFSCVWVKYIESQSVYIPSILAKVCVRVFIKILNMATICFSQQSRHWNNVITTSKRTETVLVLIIFEWF